MWGNSPWVRIPLPPLRCRPATVFSGRSKWDAPRCVACPHGPWDERRRAAEFLTDGTRTGKLATVARRRSPARRADLVRPRRRRRRVHHRRRHGEGKRHPAATRASRSCVDDETPAVLVRHRRGHRRRSAPTSTSCSQLGHADRRPLHGRRPGRGVRTAQRRRRRAARPRHPDRVIAEAGVAD